VKGNTITPQGPFDHDFIIFCVVEDKIDQAFSEWYRGINIPAVIRSTVPPGTANRLSAKYPGITIISNPEFLRASDPLVDAMIPHKLVIGHTNAPHLAQMYADVWANIVPQEKIVITDNKTAELTKLASNYVLAAYISIWNQLRIIAASIGVNSNEVAKLLRMDPRISAYGTIHGAPYGGFCLPKDMAQLERFAEREMVPAPLVAAVREINEYYGGK
jgi:UDPglucose 6-dehydrogenase